MLLLGGTSQIGLATALALRPTGSIVLCGRDRAALEAAADSLRAHLPGITVDVEEFDAAHPPATEQLVSDVFGRGPVDVVLPAFGVLGDQASAERAPQEAASILGINVVGQAVALLAAAQHLRRQGHGALVVYSSIAGVRARRANFIYGASKSAIDALGTGLAAALHGTGVHVLVVRPGFVVGRMTERMPPAPLAVTPEQVARATVNALRRGRRTVWVPASMAPIAVVFRALPWTVWRRLPR